MVRRALSFSVALWQAKGVFLWSVGRKYRLGRHLLVVMVDTMSPNTTYRHCLHAVGQVPRL